MDSSEVTRATPADGVYSSYKKAFNALRKDGIKYGYGFHSALLSFIGVHDGFIAIDEFYGGGFVVSALPQHTE